MRADHRQQACNQLKMVSSLQQVYTYKIDIIQYNAERFQTLWTFDALLL